MCGIFGYIGPARPQAALLAQALAIKDERRGSHSTGFVVRFRDSVQLTKKAVRGTKFVAQRHMERLFRRPWTVLLGHNRFATSGAVTDRNAHPFRVRMSDGSPAYAVHNGVVPAAELAARFNVAAAAVDSETYFRAIAARAGRTQESFIKALNQVTQVAAQGGDLAVLWFFPRSKTVYAWRTSRPLYIVDARSVGLGRWFVSEREIFVDSWKILGGAVPPISKVRCFMASTGGIYRVRDDGDYEVEMVADLDLPKPAASRYFPGLHRNDNGSGGGLLFAAATHRPASIAPEEDEPADDVGFELAEGDGP